MATNHAIYFEDGQDLLDVLQSPGFPQLRLHPALLDGTRIDEITTDQETLVLAMHCSSDQLLVISNRSIHIYKVPRLKSGLFRAGAVAAKVGVGFIPVVGELLDAGEKLLKPVEWVKARKERKEDKIRTQEGMPTRELIDIMRWDYREPNTLKALLIYKEKILLRNAFEWKTAFKAPLQKTAGEAVVVTVESGGIRIENGKQKTFATYLDSGWAPLQLGREVIECARQALEAAGWSVEVGDQRLVLRNSG